MDNLDVAPAPAAPDAPATPATVELSDAQVAALTETGIDVEDLTEYLSSKKGWDSQHNRRLMDIANAKTENDQKLAEVLGQLATNLTPAEPDADPAAPVIAPDVFGKEFGIKDPEDWQREVTLADLYRVAEGLTKMGTTRFDEVGGKVAAVEDRFGGVEERVEGLFTQLQEDFQEGALNELAADFPHAHPEDMKRAIADAPKGAGFMEHVKAKAKESHDRVASAIEKARLEERRKHVPEPAYTGAGAGGAPTGDPQPNPWKREGRDALHSRGDLG